MGKIKSRRTLHVNSEELTRLRKLQGKIKSITGYEPSLTILMKEIMELPNFETLENQILKKISKVNPIELKFDKELK